MFFIKTASPNHTLDTILLAFNEIKFFRLTKQIFKGSLVRAQIFNITDDTDYYCPPPPIIGAYYKDEWKEKLP